MFLGEWDGHEVAVKVVAAKEKHSPMDVHAKAQDDQHQQMTQLEAILMAIVSAPCDNGEFGNGNGNLAWLPWHSAA